MNVPIHFAKILAGSMLGLAFAMALPAGAVEVTFDVQPRLLNLGETATATLTFHGVRSAPSVEFPSVPGLQITGTGQQMQFGTGGSRVSLTYTLFPQKAGTHTIGPYNLDFQGQAITIPAVTIEVRAPSGNEQQREMLFARLQLPATPPYIHQVFDLVIHLYSLPDVELTRDINLLGGFPESGFVLSGFEELQMVREEVDGQFYNLRRFRARARALTAGSFPLQPGLRVGVIDRQAQRRHDPFEGFFDPFGGQPATPVNVQAPSQTLTVQSIPDEGRPEDFDGAVGRFEFAMDVRPRELKMGEPITVSMRLQGVGNIASARPPAYEDTEAFKAYEARLVGDSPDPASDAGVKTFEQVVIPRTVELHELPALQFSFFDPEAAQYRTVAAGPFPLTVHPSENGASSLMLQIPGAAGAGGHALVLGSDIVYLKPAPDRWVEPAGPGTMNRLQTVLPAAAPLALAGLYFATRRRNRLSRDIALARRHQAPRRARSALRRADAALKTGAEPGAVFTPLAEAVSDYFGHRLNLPPGAVDAPLILDRLQSARADESTLAKWREFFALSDQIRYASSATLPHEALETWIAAVTSLLRKAERTKL